MKILLTGATGFIGRKLVERLQKENHQIYALARSPERANLPGVTVIKWSRFEDSFESPEKDFDVVVNLMGENVAGARWTQSRKDALVSSRVLGTQRLFEELQGIKIAKFVQASAIGFYGNSVSEVDETSLAGKGFLAELTQQWESAANDFSNQYKSICFLRFGIVLGNGGALAKMLTAFKMGVAGRLGSGDQFMSWVHINDVVGMLYNAINEADWQGPINVTAPAYVTNNEFTKTLGKVLGRPTVLPAPAFALKLALGEMSQILLDGQPVVPNKAQELGYNFEFPTLEGALKDIVS